MKSIDIFIGIKAEQSLRDAVRETTEFEDVKSDALELCPVGKKDWIAGVRIPSSVGLADVSPKTQFVLRELVGLGTHQRIRSEAIRLYAVKKAVPVFKEATESLAIEEPVPPPVADENKDSITCPICEAKVHRYNTQFDPSGKIVGCYLCRGEARSRR